MYFLKEHELKQTKSNVALSLHCRPAQLFLRMSQSYSIPFRTKIIFPVFHYTLKIEKYSKSEFYCLYHNKLYMLYALCMFSFFGSMVLTWKLDNIRLGFIRTMLATIEFIISILFSKDKGKYRSSSLA